MQDDLDGGMGLPDDELTGETAVPDLGPGGGETEVVEVTTPGRPSGGARVRSSSGRKPAPAKTAGARKPAAPKAAKKSVRKVAKKSIRKVAKKSVRKVAKKGGGKKAAGARKSARKPAARKGGKTKKAAGRKGGRRR